MRAGCRAWIKRRKRGAGGSAKAGTPRTRNAVENFVDKMRTPTLGYGKARSWPAGFGHGNYAPIEQSKSPADRAYRLIPSFIQCWFHPACLPSLHTPRPQDSLTRQLSCARPANPAIIHLAEIPVIFRTLWKTRGLENAQPGSASMRRPFSDEQAGRYRQTYSHHRPSTPLSPFLSTGSKQDFGSQKT